jgi:hypothetical protein
MIRITSEVRSGFRLRKLSASLLARSSSRSPSRIPANPVNLQSAPVRPVTVGFAFRLEVRRGC